jgi:hypothetical protein
MTVKDYTCFVDASGWEDYAQRTFDGNETPARCYIILYKWKQTQRALKYNALVTEIATRQMLIC